MKKAMLLCLVLVAVLLVACNSQSTDDPTQATTAPTIQFIPGVEDSIFDPTEGTTDNEAPTTDNETPTTGNETPAPNTGSQNATEPTKPEETNKPETPTPDPSIPDAPQNPGGNTEPAHPEDPVKKPEPTQPSTDGSEGTTAPTEESQPAESVIDYTQLTYEEFNALPVEQAQAIVLSLKTTEDYDAFFAWYNKAVADYEAAHPGIEVGGGIIDMDKLLGGN